MAKGLRCKTKRAFRAVKRQHVSATVEKARMQVLQRRLAQVQEGYDVGLLERKPPNKFLYPDAPDAEFPQWKPRGPALDFRSEKLPLAGLVGRGQRKKFTDEEKESLVAEFNCLPGRTLGREVENARRALRLKESFQGVSEMQLGDTQEASQAGSSAAHAFESGAAMECDAGGEETTEEAAQALAEIARSKIPVVSNSLKSTASSRLKSTSKIRQRR